MRANCERHPFDFSEDLCDRCGHDFCGDCLVFTRGPKSPPICVTCALVAAGVRPASSAPVAKYSRREIKRIRKERLAEPVEAPAEAPEVASPLVSEPDEFEVAPEPAAASTDEDDWGDVPTWGSTVFSPGS